MAQAGFVLTALLAIVFFVWRRKLDPLAIAMGSSLVYFVPGFFGTVTFSAGLFEYAEPILPTVYGAMGIVLLALVASAAVVDLVPVRGVYFASFQRMVPGVLLAFTSIATAISIAHTGVYFLCLDKAIILKKIDVWYSYASLSVPFCIAMAYVLRQRVIAFIGCIFLLADLYAGFRLGVGITFLAVAMLSISWLSQGWKKFFAFAMIITMTGAAIFLVKHLIAPAKYVTASYCERVELTTMDYLGRAAGDLTRWRMYYTAFVTHSEPFIIQATLNEVVRKDFRTDAGYLIDQLLAGLPLGVSLFGIDSSAVKTFNSRAQPVLFPDVRFAMANNPWAQAYAAGGLGMVSIFAIGYAAILGGLTLLFRRTEGALKAGVAVIAVWIGFYFHRNDLFIEIGYIKHVVYIFIAALALSWLMSLAREFCFGKNAQ